MINANRILDIAIFFIEKENQIGKAKFQSGLHQLKRDGNFYHFSKPGELPYVSVSTSENVAVLKMIYSRAMFYG